jgi:hypothetical protein
MDIVDDERGSVGYKHDQLHANNELTMFSQVSHISLDVVKLRVIKSVHEKQRRLKTLHI